MPETNGSISAETKGSIKGSKSRGGGVHKGRVQKEIVELLTTGGLTIPQVALRRHTSVKAVYKVLAKAKAKGMIFGSAFKGFNLEAHCSSTPTQEHDYHAQRFVVGIIDFNTAYAKQQYLNHVGNKGIEYKGNTIKLRRECIEIYSNTRFKAPTNNECLEMANKYWMSYIDSLQSKYGAVLLKAQRDNIKMTYCHVAITENGIALRQNTIRDRLMYYDEATHKLWLTTDRSFRGADLEFQGKDALRDSELFEPHLKDWRSVDQATPSQMQGMIRQEFDLLHGIQQNQVVFDHNMASHILAIQELGKGVKELREAVKELMNKDG